MDYKLWATCNDLNSVAMNQSATLDAFSYILDGMDKAAAEASRGGQEAATAYLSQYTNFSRMLFMLLGVMEDQGKEAQRLIEQTFDLMTKTEGKDPRKEKYEIKS